jgi:stage V sporulation protein S
MDEYGESPPYDDDDFDEVGMDEGLGSSSRPDVIKVSAKSRSTAVAGAIAGVIREHRYAEVQAIGAGAVNQAVKALAIARGYLARDGIDIVFTPFFTEVDIDGQERTAVRFAVEPRP